MVVIGFNLINETGCITQTQKLDCFNSIINQNKHLDVYSFVEKSLKDTINSWINKKIELAQGYKNEMWKIDALIFNKQKNRCFIIIIEIDSSLTAKLDYVTYGVAQLQNKTTWNFYFAGITSLVVPKGNDFDKLSIIARKEIIRGGIIEKFDCKINEDYINNWFNQDLYDKHIKFLNSKVQ